MTKAISSIAPRMIVSKRIEDMRGRFQGYRRTLEACELDIANAEVAGKLDPRIHTKLSRMKTVCWRMLRDIQRAMREEPDLRISKEDKRMFVVVIAKIRLLLDRLENLPEHSAFDETEHTEPELPGNAEEMPDEDWHPKDSFGRNHGFSDPESEPRFPEKDFLGPEHPPVRKRGRE